jgi:hypothetical protein
VSTARSETHANSQRTSEFHAPRGGLAFKTAACALLAEEEAAREAAAEARAAGALRVGGASTPSQPSPLDGGGGGNGGSNGGSGNGGTGNGGNSNDACGANGANGACSGATQCREGYRLPQLTLGNTARMYWAIATDRHAVAFQCWDLSAQPVASALLASYLYRQVPPL